MVGYVIYKGVLLNEKKNCILIQCLCISLCLHLHVRCVKAKKNASILSYATIYTMFPVFSLVLDQDVKPEMALLYPELYKDLTKVMPHNALNHPYKPLSALFPKAVDV